MPTNDPFDDDETLGELRYDVAALCKSLILAREKQQTGFLAADAYRRWGLENIEADRFSCEYHLRQARVIMDKLWRYCFCRGSGGVLEGDPLGDFKVAVAFFVDHCSVLPEAAEMARIGENIVWDNLADWASLSMIRDVLDKLPHPTHDRADIPTELAEVWHEFTVTEQEILLTIWHGCAGGELPVSEIHYRLGWTNSPDPDKNLRVHMTNISKKLKRLARPLPWKRQSNQIRWRSSLARRLPR